MNLQPNMNSSPNMDMVIDDFRSSNINNFDEVRGHFMTSNKSTFRTVSMFSSKTLVDYAIRMEYLNNVLDNNKVKDPIDSSQLSYAK